METLIMDKFNPGDAVVPSKYWTFPAKTELWSGSAFYVVDSDGKVTADNGVRYTAYKLNFDPAPAEDYEPDWSKIEPESAQYDHYIEVAFRDGSVYDVGVDEDFGEEDLEDILYDLNSDKDFVRIECFIVPRDSVARITWVM